MNVELGKGEYATFHILPICLKSAVIGPTGRGREVRFQGTFIDDRRFEKVDDELNFEQGAHVCGTCIFFRRFQADTKFPPRLPSNFQGQQTLSFP